MASTIIQWGIIFTIFYFLFIAFRKGKTNPLIPAIIFLVIGISLLIIYFAIQSPQSGEGLSLPSHDDNILMGVSFGFLIVSAYFFYRLSKKEK